MLRDTWRQSATLKIQKTLLTEKLDKAAELDATWQKSGKKKPIIEWLAFFNTASLAINGGDEETWTLDLTIMSHAL